MKSLSIIALIAASSSICIGADLPRSSPEAQGVSSSAVLSFVEAADKDIDSMHSFMLLRHGHVVAEGWWSPYNAQSPHPLFSLSKSFASTAVGLAIALLTAGLTMALMLRLGFGVLVVLYFVLQIAYTFWLKEAVILDVMAIAAGFVIRAAAGGVIIAVPVSPWLIICTFLLALFLGFSKRRHELILLEARATEHRASLKEYSPYFLDQMIAVVTASTVVAYAIWTVSPEIREKLGTEKLYLTIPFVLFGIFRYLYLVHQREEGGNPTQLLLTDRPLLLDVLLWIITVAVLLYWKP